MIIDQRQSLTSSLPQQILLGLSLVFLMAGMVLGAVNLWQSGWLGHAVTPATPVPTARAYGFSTGLEGLSDRDLAARLDAMKAAGAGWVRFDLSWAVVQEHGASAYNWAAYDRIVAALNSRGLKGLAIIDFTPAWARPAACHDSKLCAPADPAAFADFAGLAAERYGSQGLRDWEIWNEPNIKYRYRPVADPAGYVKLLSASYRAIKAADPAAVVVAGGTAPAATGNGDYRPDDFTRALYDAGAAGTFDALAAHPYTYPNTPADNLPLGAWAQLTTMRRLMVQHGDAGKQIWLTEFGAPTDGPNKAGEFVSEEQQALILTDAMRLSRQTGWLGPFFWYDYQDAGTNASTSENFYGLVRRDGTHKPAYDAWQQAVEK